MSRRPVLSHSEPDAQDHLEQRDPQRFGDRNLFLGPRRTAPTDRFLPGGEAPARREAVAVGSGFERLLGISGPDHRPDQFLSPQNQIITRAPRNGNDERADCPIGEGGGCRDLLGQCFGGDDLPGGAGVERRHERAEFALGRRVPPRFVAPVDKRVRSVMRNDVADHFGNDRKLVDQRALAPEARHQLVVQSPGAPGHQAARNGDRQFEPQREKLREQLGHGALGIGHAARPIVVTGEQAPEPPANDDRDRQRGADAHVLEILDVDRRNGAQDAHRKVEFPALETARREDRHRLGIDVGDDAEGVLEVQAPRLVGNVGPRVAKAEEGLEMAFARFGDNLARKVWLEAVDHHPVEADEPLQVARGLMAQLCDALRALEPFGDRPERGAVISEAVGVVRLLLDDQQPPRQMQRAIEQPSPPGEFDAEDPLDRAHVSRLAELAAQEIERFGGEVIGEPVAELQRPLEAQDLVAIGRHMRDVEIAGDRDQRAEILDRAGCVDRFAIAIGEIDLRAGDIVHATRS